MLKKILAIGIIVTAAAFMMLPAGAWFGHPFGCGYGGYGCGYGGSPFGCGFGGMPFGGGYSSFSSYSSYTHITSFSSGFSSCGW